MPDEASILRVAEAERDQAERALNAHCLTHRRGSRCDTCRSLARHFARTQRQVELLTPAGPEMEAMW